uniref:DNA primase n=1 Tax=Magnetococcus massalia (strain MO-1) TaxID=451514 RepID=A0A1S7LID3_MAGMO|nr:DNA primase [Candidatus Magnetococcus massalia]
MARFDQAFLELLRERVDIVDVIERQLPLKKRGSNWLGLCPFHQEKTPSFNVSQEKGFFKCFGCGAHGDAIEFVMRTKGVPFGEAVEELASGAGLQLPESGQRSPAAHAADKRRDQLREVMEEAKRFFQGQLRAPNGRRAMDYLRRRGLSQELLSRYQVGFAPPGWRNLLDFFGGGDLAAKRLVDNGLLIQKEDGSRYDRFRDRVIFPIHDSRGRCIAFGGRVLDESKPKYINSPETPLYNKGEVLYALHMAQEQWSRGEPALIVEGYMDAVMLAEYGLPGTVATLGTAVTEHHLKQLWRRTKRLIFCFDGDAAGRRAAWRALERGLDGLQADRHLQFLFLPEGEDPDSLVRKEGPAGLKQRMAHAESPMGLMVRTMGEELDLLSPEGRAAAVHRMRPLIQKVGDPVLRQLYAEDFGQKLGGLNADQVLQSMPQAASGGPNSHQPPHVQAPAAPQGWRQREGNRPYKGPPERGGRWRERREPIGFNPGPIGGRDFEQALLALILSRPTLLLEHEESLAKLELKNAQLNQLLTELLELGAMLDDADQPWPLERLHDPQSQRLIKAIQVHEETPLDDLEKEFMGCLLSCQLQMLEKELRQVQARVRELYNDQDLAKLTSIKKEIDRLNKQRQSTTLT